MTSHRENPSTRARRAARIPAAALIALLLLSILAVPARARAAASTSSTAPPGFTGGEAEDADPLPDPDRQLAQYGELRFTVDPAVVPRTAEIEPVDGSRDPRPVGAIAYPDGETQEFVLDHVMLHTSSREELAGFVARWNGTVVYSTEADAEGQDHLVRVDPSGADVANLAANLRAVERHHAGEHRLSDDRALRLLALMAAELATGTEVTVDWLARPTVSPRARPASRPTCRPTPSTGRTWTTRPPRASAWPRRGGCCTPRGSSAPALASWSPTAGS